MINKIIYKGASDLEFLQSLLLRVACISAIVYLAFHYNENPPVISVGGVICFLFFVFIGNDEIIVYSDKLVQKDTSIAGFFLKSKFKIYETKSIKAARLPEEAKSSITNVGIAFILASILPIRIRNNTKGQIQLDLKTGETITILTSLGRRRMKRIVETINSLCFAAESGKVG